METREFIKDKTSIDSWELHETERNLIQEDFVNKLNDNTDPSLKDNISLGEETIVPFEEEKETKVESFTGDINLIFHESKRS